MNKVLLKKRLCFDKFYDKFFGVFCRSRDIVNRNTGYIYCACHCILSLYVASLYLYILNWIKLLAKKHYKEKSTCNSFSLPLSPPLPFLSLSLKTNLKDSVDPLEKKKINWRHQRLFL